MRIKGPEDGSQEDRPVSHRVSSTLQNPLGKIQEGRDGPFKANVIGTVPSLTEQDRLDFPECLGMTEVTQRGRGAAWKQTLGFMYPTPPENAWKRVEEEDRR